MGLVWQLQSSAIPKNSIGAMAIEFLIKALLGVYYGVNSIPVFALHIFNEDFCSAAVAFLTPLKFTLPVGSFENPHTSDPFTLRVFPSETPIVLTKLRCAGLEDLEGASQSWP